MVGFIIQPRLSYFIFDILLTCSLFTINRGFNDIANLTAEDLQSYDTIVIDTVGRLLEILSLDLIKNNPEYMSAWHVIVEKAKK